MPYPFSRLARARRQLVQTAWVLATLIWANRASGEIIDFHVLPSQSVLQVSGEFFNIGLVPQPGPTDSSRAAAAGIWSIDFDSTVAPTSLELVTGTLMLGDSGSWSPAIGGGEVGNLGTAPANVALQIIHPILGEGWGAIRDLELHVISAPLPISNGQFSAALLFDNTQGSFDYHLDILGVSDIGTESLVGEQTSNDPFLLGKWERAGTLMTITVPIRIEALRDPDLFFDGELVANAIVSSVAGDLDGDTLLSPSDADQWTTWISNQVEIPSLDFNQNGQLDFADRSLWLAQVARIYVGDAGFDGLFDGSDLIQVFQRGEYDDGQPQNSTWADGDWNGDGEFDSGDLVAAFADGGYEQGPRAAGPIVAVPETSGPALVVLAFLVGQTVRHRRRH